VTQSLDVAKSVAQSIERTSKVVEQLPARIEKEREVVVGLLEDRQGRLAKTMGEARRTIAAVEQLAQRSTQVAEVGERVALNLRDTAQGFTQSSQALDALLSKHSPPNPNAKPFDIEPYATASADIKQTVGGLVALIDRSDAMLAKRPWAAPLDDADARLAARIDQVFVRALLLLGAGFLLALAYRWLTLRWARKAAP
jgi:hypothetical protein